MTLDSKKFLPKIFWRPLDDSPPASASYPRREDADTHPELVYGSVDFTAKALLEPDLPGCLAGQFGWETMT